MNSERNPKVLGVKFREKGLPRPIVEWMKQTIDWLLSTNRFNALYRGLPACQPLDFSRVLLEEMNVRVDVAGLPVETIPETGSLLVIANHPFGIIEGAALDALMLSRRPDVSIMAIYHLANIPEWQGRIIQVDQRGGRRRRTLNVQSWRRSFRLLSRGGAIAVFPAGRVARFEFRKMSVAERPWSSHIGTMARLTKAPVIPIFFHGHNGWMYQLLGFVCPPLQDLLLIREATNKRGWKLRVSIGRIIPPDELSALKTDEEAARYLRQKVLTLASQEFSKN